MYLTKPFSKMFNNLLKFDKLLSMMPHTCWSKKKKERKEKIKIPSLVTYLILNQRNCNFYNHFNYGCRNI